MLPVEVARAIEHFRPTTVSPAVACFARDVVMAAAPETPVRAKAFLFAACRLGAFCESVGLELSREAVLCDSVIERCCMGATTMSAATRRTLRSNLRALVRRVNPLGPLAPLWPRERARAPYTRGEIASYLALADAQPTQSRRMRASGLVCLGAGAGLVGADLKAVTGSDVTSRPGGLVVCVRGGRRPRVVPVLRRHHDRLLVSASWAGTGLLIGGTSPARRNVTTPLTASLAGGAELPRIDISRLRATWLCEVAKGIGLHAFMEAAGITCSQRLGDLVAHLDALEEPEALSLLGGGP